MADSPEQERLDLGHQGAGDDCIGQVVRYGGGATLAGAAYGTAEGCFITQVPGSTTPMLMRALKVIVARSVLFGAVGGTFAASACLSARARDKDDYVNAAIGGTLAGSIFGLKHRSWSIGLGIAAGMAVVLGAIKYRHGTYLPPFPEQNIASSSSDVTNRG